MYQDWPIEGAVLVYDGEEVWTTDWNKPNKPKMHTLFFFYFVNLPWVTQDDNVQLGAPERSKLPGFDKEFHAIRMSFRDRPSPGKTAGCMSRIVPKSRASAIPTTTAWPMNSKP